MRSASPSNLTLRRELEKEVVISLPGDKYSAKRQCPGLRGEQRKHINPGKAVDVRGGIVAWFETWLQIAHSPAWPRWRESVPGEEQGSGLKGWLSCGETASCIVNRAHCKCPGF